LLQNEILQLLRHHSLHGACRESPLFVVMNFGSMGPGDGVTYLHGRRPPGHRHFSTPRAVSAPSNVINVSEASLEDTLNPDGDNMELPVSPQSVLQRPIAMQVSPWSPPTAVPARPPPPCPVPRAPKRGTQCQFSTSIPGILHVL
jgi:hypothetical protein